MAEFALVGKAAESTYLPPNRVTCVPGYGSLLVATIYDPTSNPVSVVIGGVTYVSGTDFTLTARGTNIVWTGFIPLSLVANTRYPWAVSQGSYSDSGSYYETPAKGTNHRLHFVSCDNNELFSAETVGHWQYMRQQFDAGIEISGVVMTDDDGYVDGINIKDDGSGSYNLSGMSGKLSTNRPTGSALLDDYLIAWCSVLGMLGPDQTVYTAADLLDDPATRDLRQALWGREENRAICRKNLNRIHAGQSDHDYIDDMGWGTKPSYGNHFANGKAAWDAFYGLIAPKIADIITPTDTGAGHWVCEFGDLSLGSLDYITNAARPSWTVGNEPVSYGDSTQLTQFTTVFGNAQIDDYLNAVNTIKAPLHIMCTQFSLRYLVTRTNSTPPEAFTTVVGLRSHGAQHPLYDHCLVDYQRLYTDDQGVSGNPQPSIMSSNITNGVLGACMMVGGDLHLAQAVSLNRAAYAGNLAEDLWHINIATVNGSSLTGSVGVTGDQIADCKLEFAEVANTYDEYYGFYIDVRGDTSPPSIETVFSNKSNTVILNKQFMPVRGGNSGYDMDVKLDGPVVSVIGNGE